MFHRTRLLASALAMIALAFAASDAHAAKPLKVFILAGQSNMQGHAAVTTFDRIALSKPYRPLYEAMTDHGQPRTVDTAYISEIGSGPDGGAERVGKLNATYGVARGDNIGPEYTFGIYMARRLGDEPFLIIKTAWGGKSLNTDFRPPSAGPYDNWANPDGVSDEQKAQRAAASGVYYRKMMDHVKKVLADPGRVVPGYDKAAGYEVAGFVWFQGWNDMVDRGTYPNRNKIDGYALYTDLMAKFIQDVRKDLNAPGMKFVIGVIGVDGTSTPESEAARPPRYQGIKPAIEKAMSDPAKMPQFKGNVAAVMTGDYWDHELDAALVKKSKLVDNVVRDKAKADNLDRDAQNKLRAELEAKHITDHDRAILKGKSAQGFHYNGSGLTMGAIGKAFAEAMIKMMK